VVEEEGSGRGRASTVCLLGLAALADADGVVRGLSNDEICAAAGVEDRTYRRARPGLLSLARPVLCGHHERCRGLARGRPRPAVTAAEAEN
jgi:hypothetical protein